MKAAFGPKADDEQVGLLAQVMGLGSSTVAASASRLGPEQLQRARFKAFMSLLSRLVSYGSTLVVLEDLHWADPTSLRLTEEISSLTMSAPSSLCSPAGRSPTRASPRSRRPLVVPQT